MRNKNFLIIHNLKDPTNKQNRTYREVNFEKKHNIPLGKLVELSSGVRLFVVSHNRDCDGTPLYSLCHDREDIIRKCQGFANPAWTNGYTEDSLKEIK